MRLMSGSLYYKIQCPTVAADVLIPFESRLDDGNWHTVSVSILGITICCHTCTHTSAQCPPQHPKDQQACMYQNTTQGKGKLSI